MKEVAASAEDGNLNINNYFDHPIKYKMKTFIAFLCEEAHHKRYYRGTDNPTEDELVKSNTLLPSINHLTRKREIGISVSDVKDVGKYFKYMYEISGVEIGEGSDGEPLLDPTSIKFIRWIKR